MRRDVGVALLTGALVGGTVLWAEETREASRTDRAEMLENVRFVRQMSFSADTRAAPFSGLILRGASMAGLSLRGADFRGADLAGADLSGTDLSDADLRDANLTDALLRDAILVGADLVGADLTDSVLWGADVSSAAMWDAKVSQAVFFEATLSGADLRFVDLSDARSLDSAQLEGVVCDATTIWPQDVEDRVEHRPAFGGGMPILPVEVGPPECDPTETVDIDERLARRTPYA